MINRSLILIFAVLAMVACSGRTGSTLLNSREGEPTITPTPPKLENIQVSQTSVLPPYGLRVKADVASLKLRVTSSEEDTQARLITIQTVVDDITKLADKSDAVAVQSLSVSQIGASSAEREASSYYYDSQSYDSASAILMLTTTLAGDNPSVLESLITFGDFLNTFTLPETVTISTLSIETRISDPEIYRHQLIEQVYQEVEALQAARGDTVTFEINGLYSGLKSLPLTDSEYYLYLDPSIVVKDS